MVGLKDDDLNVLIAIHVLKTHTLEQIKAIQLLVENRCSDSAYEIWADYGVYNYAGDPNDALMLLYNVPGLESWSVFCDLVNQKLYGEMGYRGKLYKVRASTPPRAVCLAILATVGMLVQSSDGYELDGERLFSEERV
jgi:hypothetical protein